MRVSAISLESRRLQLLERGNLRHVDDVEQFDLRAGERNSRIVIHAEVAHGMGDHWNRDRQQHRDQKEVSNGRQAADDSLRRF